MCPAVKNAAAERTVAQNLDRIKMLVWSMAGQELKRKNTLTPADAIFKGEKTVYKGNEWILQ